MATIPLHDGTQAIVDDSDVELLSRYHWTHSRYPMTTMECETSQGMLWRKPVSMHFLLVGCPLHGLEIDHINRNKLDNRRSNLRVVTKSENRKNRDFVHFRAAYKKTNAEAGFANKGLVEKRRNKWCTSFHWRGKRRYLGTFETEEDACAALSSMVYFLQSFD